MKTDIEQKNYKIFIVNNEREIIDITAETRSIQVKPIYDDCDFSAISNGKNIVTIELFSGHPLKVHKGTDIETILKDMQDDRNETE